MCRAWSAVLQVRIQDLVSELGAKEDELHRLRLERDDLRRVVASLDAERDRVQVGEVQAMDRVQVVSCREWPIADGGDMADVVS